MMKYLNELGIAKDSVKKIENTTSKEVQKELKENNELVKDNILFLKEIGIENFEDIFTAYTEMFLMDNTNFKNVFLKYDQADLVEKLAKNITIIEHL